MDIQTCAKNIQREQKEWDHNLTLLRESVECWVLAIPILSEETSSVFESLEIEMMETLKNFWGEKSSIIFDRKNQTAHALSDDLCMNLLTGEVTELEETGS